MSILIRGMEMPKACVYRENGHLISCPLYDIDGYCGALNTEAIHKENCKLSDCPLVEIPPHGRLIEAEPIMKFITDELNSGEFGYDQIKVLAEIQYAPTIIPAEEG